MSDVTLGTIARFWGPGCFAAALREAVESGRAQRLGRNRFGPPQRAATVSRGRRSG